MEWLSILCSFLATLLAGGGIYGLFTIRENKKAAKLENEKKEQELKEAKEDQAIEMWKSLAEEYKEQLSVHQQKCTELYEKIDVLRAKLDTCRTRCATSEILKCVNVNCLEREPKLGTRSIDIEEIISNDK